MSSKSWRENPLSPSKQPVQMSCGRKDLSIFKGKKENLVLGIDPEEKVEQNDLGDQWCENLAFGSGAGGETQTMRSH